VQGKTLYLVRWQGYTEEEDSWTEEENFDENNSCLAKFKAKKLRKALAPVKAVAPVKEKEKPVKAATPAKAAKAPKKAAPAVRVRVSPPSWWSMRFRRRLTMTRVRYDTGEEDSREEEGDRPRQVQGIGIRAAVCATVTGRAAAGAGRSEGGRARPRQVAQG
jgi:hypothetical protein